MMEYAVKGSFPPWVGKVRHQFRINQFLMQSAQCNFAISKEKQTELFIF